ncbi:MAG: YceD family protein [Ardenticatenaceae bacterium]
MQFNVAQLLKEATGATRKYEIREPAEELELDPELIVQEPLTGRIKFTKIPQGVLVTGELDTVLEVSCSRCLEPFDLAVSIELEEEFHSTTDVQTGARLPQGEEYDPATLIDEKHIVDLSEVVRQELLLVLPSLPVCREDCKGICPQCGQNLNEALCDCPTEFLDPRWEALRALLDESKE